MTERFHVGPDVDLDADDVRDSQGRRITAEYIEAAVTDVHERQRRGRRSLAEDAAPPASTRRGCRCGCPSRPAAVPRNVHGPRVARCPSWPVTPALERYLTS